MEIPSFLTNILWIMAGMGIQYILDNVLLSYKLRKSLETVKETEKRITELEKKYLQGFHPDNICPKCFQGRMKVDRHQDDCFLIKKCENCGYEYPPINFYTKK